MSRNKETLGPPPQLPTQPINYGVELEFVFAFRQSELELGYTNGVPNTLKKNLKYFEREVHPKFTQIDPVTLPDHPYNSWVILEGDDARKVRPYNLEPQMVVKRKLTEKLPTLSTLVRGTLSREDRALPLSEGYKKWIITVDHTVCGRGADIGTWLPERVIDPNKWDSYGIELASRILNTGEPADRDEIEAIIDVVKGTKISNHNAFVTNQCGLHVHVEAPQDLKVLKELALLLIVYEEEISKLHPPCRRHGHPATTGSLNSNRLGFLFDEDTVTRHLIKIDSSTHALRQSESAILRGVENRFADIRQGINNCEDASALSRLMCWPADDRPGHEHGDRNRFVNFTYLCRGDGYAQTIEFRQARGTLVAEEVHHWVNFCIALVRLADFYAENSDQFPIDSFESYTNDGGTSVHNPININKLIDLMGLSDEARDFWRHKSKGYAFYEKGDKDDRTDNEDPPRDDPLTDDEDGGGADEGDEGNGQLNALLNNDKMTAKSKIVSRTAVRRSSSKHNID